MINSRLIEASLMDTDFFADLDVFAKSEYRKFMDVIEKTNTQVMNAGLWLPVDDVFKKKYELNENITFLLKLAGNSGAMKYYYKGLEIKPDCNYITPEYYVAVPTLMVMQEAIKQNTHEPNIREIENELARLNTPDEAEIAKLMESEPIDINYPYIKGIDDVETEQRYDEIANDVCEEYKESCREEE